MNRVERRIQKGKYIIEWPSGDVSEGFLTEGEAHAEARRMMEAIKGPAVIKHLVQGGPSEYVGTEEQPGGTDLARLVRLAGSLGIPDDALDDAVHDCAQAEGLDELNALEDPDEQEDHISERERVASAINNGGFESQIEYLLEHTSVEEVERLIREATP